VMMIVIAHSVFVSLALIREHRAGAQSLQPSLRFYRPCLRTKDPVATIGSSIVFRIDGKACL